MAMGHGSWVTKDDPFLSLHDNHFGKKGRCCQCCASQHIARGHESIREMF